MRHVTLFIDLESKKEITRIPTLYTPIGSIVIIEKVEYQVFSASPPDKISNVFTDTIIERTIFVAIKQ